MGKNLPKQTPETLYAIGCGGEWEILNKKIYLKDGKETMASAIIFEDKILFTEDTPDYLLLLRHAQLSKK